MAEMNEAELAEAVTAARLARRWSVEEAARRAGINRVTWKRVEDGLGVRDTNRRAVEQLLNLGSGGVWGEVAADPGEAAAAIAREALNPELAEFTDRELLEEVEGRLLLMAAELHSTGKRTLTTTIDGDGQRRITSFALGLGE